MIGFETVAVVVDGRLWDVAVADTTERRRQGLMFVEDLGDLDGMLFIFDTDREGAFWMWNTLLPLDIAFFDGSGLLVGSLAMVPCPNRPCPLYDIGVPYRFALEAPAGVLIGLAEDARIEF